MHAALLVLALAFAGCGSTTNATPTAVEVGELASATLRVDGMTCASCEVSIRVAAEKLDGVHLAEVDYESGSARVRYDPDKVTPARIAEAISALGYPATVGDASSAAVPGGG
jgi:copper chaperone CopZ